MAPTLHLLLVFFVISKSAHEGSVKNASIDQHCEYLATTGCDGFLKVTKIAGASHEVVHKCKISDKNVTVGSNQRIESTWSLSDEGEHLFVAGERQLSFYKRSENFATKHKMPSLSHFHDISLVKAVSPTCLVTAGLDKYVKVWRITSDMKAQLLARFKAEHEVLQLEFEGAESTLAFLDAECSLGHVSLSGLLTSASQEEDDEEVDLDAIDAAMAHDEEEINANGNAGGVDGTEE